MIPEKANHEGRDSDSYRNHKFSFQKTYSI